MVAGYWAWHRVMLTITAALVVQGHDAAAHELAHSKELLQGDGSCFAGLSRRVTSLTRAQLLGNHI